MKRFRYFLPYFISFALLFLAAPAYAATISLSPSYVSVSAGETFTVNIVINAGNVRLISGQTELSYPQNLLQPVSFGFAPNWQQTFDTGTNIMAGGSIAKAGGYPTGFSGSMVMGTLTFTALRSGTATISVINGQSYVFETDGGNLFTGPLASAQVDIAPGNGNSSPANNPSNTAAPAASADQTTTLAPLPASLLGASSTAAGNGTANIPPWVWLLLAVVVVFIVWRIYRAVKGRGNKKRR